MKKVSILLVLIFASTLAFAMSQAPAEKNLDLTLKDLSGRSISLDSYKGHVVLLAFFTTWCPSCQDEMPQLETLYQKYRSREFDVVGVNIKEKSDSVKMFAKDKKLTFTILLDEKGDTAKAYQVKYIPRILILDKEGKIVFKGQYMPMDQIEKELVKIIQ